MISRKARTKVESVLDHQSDWATPGRQDHASPRDSGGKATLFGNFAKHEKTFVIDVLSQFKTKDGGATLIRLVTDSDRKLVQTFRDSVEQLHTKPLEEQILDSRFWYAKLDA